MKQYTTPTITVYLDDQALLLSAADRVVLSIKSNDVVRNFEGERLSVENDAVIVDVYDNYIILNGMDFIDNDNDGNIIPIGTYKIDTQLVTIDTGTFTDSTGTITT